ncbi:hypothetical protein F5Y11DRAFT_365841 [Daldinia sp. FL1419]|nr:hypothetical protein F5Y11DRAFT_365841 [Daldinia sp. FL1419]
MASSRYIKILRLLIPPDTWKCWKWEALCCVLVLASPLVILATLYPYDGRPLPEWPLSLSVNTLLSIYSMVLKASLAFVAASCIGQLQWTWFSQGRPIYDLVRYDNARQGAWGSLQLLWAQRMRQPLATLGGLVLVLSIGIDPFIQQLISLHDCSVAIGGKQATLPRTNRFDDQLEVPTFGHDIDLAISRGTTQSGNGLYPDCITGNCTFTESYGTLGYCSFCEDSSDEISIRTTHTPIDNSTRSPFPGEAITIKSGLPQGIYWSNSMSELSRLNTTYSVNVTQPYNMHNWDVDGVEVAKMSLFQEGYDDVWKPKRPERMTVKILAGKTSFSDEHKDMSTGQTIRGCGNGTSVNLWRCRGYGAATCRIQPCVRVYNATVKGGHLTERLLTQSGDVQWGSDPIQNAGLGMVDTQCLMPQDKTALIRLGYVIHDTLRWLPYNASFDAGGDNSIAINTTSSLLAKECLYFMNNGFSSSFGPWAIGSHFLAALRGVGGNDNADGMTISSFEGPDIIKSLYDYGRVDFKRVQEVFSNISESLTTYIRTNGNPNYSEPAVGQALHYAICIRVQWQWVAFPSFLAFMTLLLFVWTVCSKKLRYFPAWKSSPLPWLIYGPQSLGVFNTDDLEQMEHGIDEIENMSKEIAITWKHSPSPHIQTEYF